LRHGDRFYGLKHGSGTEPPRIAAMRAEQGREIERVALAHHYSS
jgi:hypothetical protein